MGHRRCEDILPNNPTWIEFKQSDGCSDRWPKTVEDKIDHPDYIDGFCRVPLDEPGRGIKWRCDLGKELAESMNLPSTNVLYYYSVQTTNHPASSRAVICDQRLA
jgi:hypothetical protein